MKIRNILWIVVMALCSTVARGEIYTLETGQFEKIKVNGNLNVVYKNLPDSTGYARFEAPEGSEGIFALSSKGDGVIRVEPEDDKWGSNDLPVLCLYSDFLSAVESYSDRTVEIVSMAPCASFSVSLIGNGTINVNDLKCNNVTASITTGNGTIFLSGKCVNANLRMVGAGLISADQLEAETVKCRILGTGSIGCWPLESLNVTGLGTTKIYYKGRPSVKKTGGGKLFELPDDFDQADKTGVEIKSFKASPEPVEVVDDDDDDEDEDDEEEDSGYQTVVTAEESEYQTIVTQESAEEESIQEESTEEESEYQTIATEDE